MISVLINGGEDGRALARTLHVLVTGAVNGIVRDVTILDSGSNGEIAAIAEHAGCRLIEASRLRDGLMQARCDWLLLLEAGSVLEPGWTEAVSAHMLGSTIPVGFMRSPRAPRGLLSRLVNPDRPLALGVLIARKQALALLKDGRGIGDLARRAAPRRLNATILPGLPA